MTSEVLMLNKNAVVIAADSAVTTGRDPHPRYSKAANKIFDLSSHGNVALTIYASAEIDNVPWELALKQFRQQDAKTPQRPKLEEYVNELITYLQDNTYLFPKEVQSSLLNFRFYAAVLHVLNILKHTHPDFVDETKTDVERKAAWSSGYTVISSRFTAEAYQNPLTEKDHKEILANKTDLESLLTIEVNKLVEFADVGQLTELAIEALVKHPTNFLNYTGLVFAGYGADEIFPSFNHIWVYGHIGKTLLWTPNKGYAITHDNDAWIQPFAQSSLIDRFTDGFDSTLNEIIYEESNESYKNIISELQASGITIDAGLSSAIISKQHKDFMGKWRTKNWDVNFHPLRRVLNSLSVPEMGHLAESLLVLEALRERVTSPSESIGGPIDVAVITKAEGLIWLKRKHFFDPDLNIKYINRSKLNYNQN
ncbi:hypothetical protein GALL_256440 [mine drainage metagenome]|uniref:Uncharacterized protein n=1 Tax=mine drainage metagenome TaxID=410659 RepID=A0A1J5RKB8_9ZZZZ